MSLENLHKAYYYPDDKFYDIKVYKDYIQICSDVEGFIEFDTDGCRKYFRISTMTWEKDKKPTLFEDIVAIAEVW